MSDGRVGQSETQQSNILEIVAKLVLKIAVICLGSVSRCHNVLICENDVSNT